jgi:hypothetical protein
MNIENESWFMGIKDKIKISSTKCCPPHYLPHKFPFGKKITKESCHLHKAKWRMSHHIIFCKLIGCKNYSSMMNRYKMIKEKL